jgi:hypothetical protein
MDGADRRAIRHGVVIAGIVWLGLSVEILLSNVVFPTRGDDDAWSVVLSYLCIFAALFGTGWVARRDGAGRRGQLIAGAVAGVMIGALTIATFAVVDNVWLGIVSQQQPKVEGFAHSGAASMREYINNGLVAGAAFFTVMLGAFGAVLGLAGGSANRGVPVRP